MDSLQNPTYAPTHCSVLIAPWTSLKYYCDSTAESFGRYVSDPKKEKFVWMMTPIHLDRTEAGLEVNYKASGKFISIGGNGLVSHFTAAFFTYRNMLVRL